MKSYLCASRWYVSRDLQDKTLERVSAYRGKQSIFRNAIKKKFNFSVYSDILWHKLIKKKKNYLTSHSYKIKNELLFICIRKI